MFLNMLVTKHIYNLNPLLNFSNVLLTNVLHFNNDFAKKLIAFTLFLGAIFKYYRSFGRN